MRAPRVVRRCCLGSRGALAVNDGASTGPRHRPSRPRRQQPSRPHVLDRNGAGPADAAGRRRGGRRKAARAGRNRAPPSRAARAGPRRRRRRSIATAALRRSGPSKGAPLPRGQGRHRRRCTALPPTDSTRRTTRRPVFADASPDRLAADELTLTNSVLAFARHASIGRVAFTRVSGSVYFDLKFSGADSAAQARRRPTDVARRRSHRSAAASAIQGAQARRSREARDGDAKQGRPRSPPTWSAGAGCRTISAHPM